MSKPLMTGRTAIGVWFALLTVIVGCEALWGLSTTIGTDAFLLAACLVPPAIVFMVWLSGAPRTVAAVSPGIDRQV